MLAALDLERGGMSRRTLLGVWAHPDDEAYLSAGLMAEYRAAATGSSSSRRRSASTAPSDPATWPPARLAALRRRELRAQPGRARRRRAPPARLRGRRVRRSTTAPTLIARHIAEVAPDLIVTFGPDGMTGHPDHRAGQRWTTDAWAATRLRAELWYATLTPDFHQRWGHVNEQIGLWADQPEPPCTPRDELATRSRSRRTARRQARRAPSPPVADRSRSPTWSGPRLPRVVAHRVVPRPGTAPPSVSPSTRPRRSHTMTAAAQHPAGRHHRPPHPDAHATTTSSDSPR